MLMFADVMHLFTHELARLGRRSLSLFFVLASALDGFLLRHCFSPCGFIESRKRCSSPYVLAVHMPPKFSRQVHEAGDTVLLVRPDRAVDDNSRGFLHLCLSIPFFQASLK